MSKALKRLTIFVLLGGLLVGCGRAASTDGPLTFGGHDQSVACYESKGYQVRYVSYGQELVRNTGDSNLTITNARLVGAHHMHLVSAWFFPPPHNRPFTGPGEQRGLMSERMPGVDWAHRIAVKGATLHPGQTLADGFSLRVDGKNGIVQAVVLDYRDEMGNSYVSRSQFRLVVDPTCKDY